MATRDETMRQFGPILVEALALLVLDEINILRTQLGLAPRTKQQVLDEINNHSHSLPRYGWMEPL